MSWNIENPMIIDPAPKLIGRRYEDGNWDDTEQEDFISVDIDIDTRNLNTEEEGELYGALDDIACYKCGYNSDGDYFGYLEVECIEVEGFGYEECGICGKITVKGEIAESMYDELTDVLEDFDDSRIEIRYS